VLYEVTHPTVSEHSILFASLTEDVRTHVVVRRWPARGVIDGTVDSSAERGERPVSGTSHGQIAALHDCLYRFGEASQFMISLDIDEFLWSKSLPRAGTSRLAEQSLDSLLRPFAVRGLTAVYLQESFYEGSIPAVAVGARMVENSSRQLRGSLPLKNSAGCQNPRPDFGKPLLLNTVCVDELWIHCVTRVRRSCHTAPYVLQRDQLRINHFFEHNGETRVRLRQKNGWPMQR
jgi:hypothetical protein